MYSLNKPKLTHFFLYKNSWPLLFAKLHAKKDYVHVLNFDFTSTEMTVYIGTEFWKYIIKNVFENYTFRMEHSLFLFVIESMVDFCSDIILILWNSMKFIF